jgi:tRNA (guanosine-2'-O-)-methyltransferase
VSRNLGPTELKRLHREWRRRTTATIAVVLEGVQGPFNVGAILRTAAAEGVAEIWYAAGATSPQNNPKVGKTALGSDRYLDGIEVATVAEAITENRTRGRRIVGIELADGGLALHDLDLTGDVCLVIGHEDRGLSTAALDGCDAIGFIPQLGKIGSLNVATATAIALYEARRQEWTDRV